MILRFAYIGTKFDELLTIDTANKEYVYITMIKVDNPDDVIRVKTAKDIDKIMSSIVNDGYALKI